MPELEPFGAALCGPQIKDHSALLVLGLREILLFRKLDRYAARMEIGDDRMKLSWGSIGSSPNWDVAWILMLDRRRLASRCEILLAHAIVPGAHCVEVKDDPRGWYRTIVKLRVECAALDDGRVERLLRICEQL